MFYVYFSRTLVSSAADPKAAFSLCVALTQCLLSRLDSTDRGNCSSVVNLNSYQGVWRRGDPAQIEHVSLAIDAKLDFQITNAPETRACVAAKLRSMRFFRSEMFESIDSMYEANLDTDIIWVFAMAVTCLMLIVCVDKWSKTIKEESKLLEDLRRNKTTPMRSKKREVPVATEESDPMLKPTNHSAA